jgi:hypothetical protein
MICSRLAEWYVPESGLFRPPFRFPDRMGKRAASLVSGCPFDAPSEFSVA